MTEKIVNGNFENGLTGWTTNDPEQQDQDAYFHDGSTNGVVEIDGNGGSNVTTYSQTFAVSADETGPNQTLTLDIGDRTEDSDQVNGLRIELRDPNGDLVDLTGVSGAGFTENPDGSLLVDALTANSFQTAVVTFKFPIAGNYTLSLIEDNTGDAGGNDSVSMAIDNVSINAVCYAAGTRIATARGEVAVETLRAGDRVRTLDHGLQALRWVGVRRLTRAELLCHPNLRPSRIRRGALGSGLPRRDLIVSPQHRLLLRSRIVRRMFGVDEVLVPAKKLLALPGFEVAHDLDCVDYVHFLCDRHEIVFAEGAPSESLYLGPQAVRTLDRAALAEIRAIFPGLGAPAVMPEPARMIVREGVEQMAQRHLKNRKALLDPAAGVERVLPDCPAI